MHPVPALVRFDGFRRRTALNLAVAVAAASVWCASDADAPPRTQTVKISMSAFEPKELTIAPGTKVVWTNVDEMPHTVTSRDRSFASKGLDTSDKFEYTFQRDGDFEYYCTVHPFMTGVIHVRH